MIFNMLGNSVLLGEWTCGG